MNKKFVIILAAACVVCLGIGIFIGGGLSQNNLSATGASVGSFQNVNVGSEVDALTALIEDTQDKIEDIQGRIQAKFSDLQVINDKISAAGSARGEVVHMIKTKAFNMTSSIYDNCNKIGLSVPTWGTVLSPTEWKNLETKIQDRMDALRAEADTAYSDINTLNTKYNYALDEMADLTKRLHDATMRDIQNRDKVS